MLRDASGAALTLGAALGSGGEGKVFRLNEHPHLAAKIYATSLGPQRTGKLDGMVRAGDDVLRAIAAWPTGMLYARAKPVGFTMPLLETERPLHELFGPRSRHERFPHANWTFLIHTARNLARAFSVLHERQIVVGDVNSNNIVVRGDSTARLIDCDSFQFPWNGSLFRCNVGVADYQPPELQHGDLSQIERLPQHDLFGLAVIVFQLLFVGKHPFAGVLPPGVAGTGAIGANVAARRYFYAPHARRQGLRPPPGSPALNALTPQVAELFTRAFLGEPAERPTATQWYAALEDLEHRTVACAKNAIHRHLRDAACPWCALERHGLHYFMRPGSRPEAYGIDESIWQRVTNDEVERVWKQIASVRAPQPVASTMPPKRRYRATPLHLWSNRRRFAYAACATALVALSVAALRSGQGALAAFCLAAYVVLAVAIRPDARVPVARAWRRESETRKTYAAAERAWQREATGERFIQARARLAHLRKGLHDQGARYAAEMAELERLCVRRALEYVLSSRAIPTSNAYHIDERTRNLLRRHGIVTAAHVTRENLRRVTGLSRHRKPYILLWRQSIEHEFGVRPKKLRDASAIRAIKLRHVRERTEAWSRLTTESSALAQLARDIEGQRPSLQKRAHELADALHQAEADAKVSPLFYKTWT